MRSQAPALRRVAWPKLPTLEERQGENEIIEGQGQRIGTCVTDSD